MSMKARQLGFSLALCLVLGVLLTGCSKEKAREKYLASGQRYYDKGQYGDAAIQFQNAIQEDPNYSEAYYKKALAAIKLGAWQDAYQGLQTTLRLNPDNYAARLDMAKLLIASRRFGDAKEHLQVLEEKDGNNPEVHLVYATYYDSGLKDSGAAVAELGKAIQLNRNYSDAYLSMGMIQMEAQLWPEAEKSLKTAVSLAPKSADTLLALGNFYQSRGRYPEAEQAYRQAIQIAPDDPNPRVALASLFLAENKNNQAEELLRQSRKDFPNNSLGYRLLGDYYWRTGQFDKAEAEYADLYRDHPKDPVVKGNYVELLIVSNHLDDARRLNDEMLRDQPSSLDAQLRKARIENLTGRPNDAVNTLQAVLKTDPDNGIAHNELGNAFTQLGNSSRAEAEWRETVRLRPDLVDAHRALAQVAIRNNDTGLLQQEADQIVSLLPASPEGYLLRGMAEFDHQQFSAAELSIKTSLEKESNNPPAYVQLGRIRMMQKQPAEAEKAYQQALSQDPNSSDALGGLANVYLTEKQPDKALAAINAQIAKYPNNSNFHTMLGMLLNDEKKDPSGAEAEFRKAIGLNRNNVTAYVQLAVLEGERGDFDAALSTYLEGAKNNPAAIDFYYRAGNIYESKKDWDKAKEMYQKVLAVEPDNGYASNSLAYVMLEQGGNIDVAFAMAQTARRKLPDNPHTADTLGWAFYHKKVYASAINLFKEAVKQQPESSLYNYHLGLAYAKNGQVSLAQRQLEHLNPNSSEAEDLRRTLAEVKGQG